MIFSLFLVRALVALRPTHGNIHINIKVDLQEASSLELARLTRFAPFMTLRSIHLIGSRACLNALVHCGSDEKLHALISAFKDHFPSATVGYSRTRHRQGLLYPSAGGKLRAPHGFRKMHPAPPQTRLQPVGQLTSGKSVTTIGTSIVSMGLPLHREGLEPSTR